MLVGHLSMPHAPSLGVTRRASVDCHSNADAIWTTGHHDKRGYEALTVIDRLST